MVFSHPEAVRLIQREFIPVALKAGLVNNPPPGVEGRLYAEIGRSKPAPQGICVANSAGKALAWALSFNSDRDIPKFLRHAQGLFRDSPDASQAVTTERYLQFPGNRLPDIADTGRKLSTERHGDGERCAGQPVVAAGTLVGRIIGRALDDDGRPLPDTLRQEHYMEARLEIAPAVQQELIRAAKRSGEFAVPDAFTRALVEPAYLGQLDVNPRAPHPGGVSERFEAVMLATKQDTEFGIRLQITGESDLAGRQQKGRSVGDGRQWEHRVTLGWEGFVDIRGDRISRVVMLANGRERLRWGNRGLFQATEPAAAHLMAGHAIDLNCRARYGLICEPAATE